MNTSLQWMTALYGVLIRLYPGEFKREFADELHSVFTALAQDAASAGPLALVVFCLRELRDFPINLFHAHLEKNPMSRIFNADSVRFMLRGVFAFVVFLATYNVAFYLMMTQIDRNGTLFYSSGFLADTYQALILLTAWVMAAAIGGTIFAVIMGERPRVHWLATLAIVTSLPWTIPYTILGLNGQLSPAVFGLNSQFNPNQLELRSITDFEYGSIWVKAVALLLFIAICSILAFMLFREQTRFRWFVLATAAVWLPQLLTSEAFHLTPMVSSMNETQLMIEGLLINLTLGALLAAMLGLLLKDRRKMVWLIAAGALLYPFVSDLFYQQIYFRLMPPLFPMINFVTLDNLTTEQLALLSGVASAATGLLFAIPLALIFAWLQNGKFPSPPEKALQATAQ